VLTSAPPAGDDDALALDELERRHIVRAFAVAGGDFDHAAELLGIRRAALRGKLWLHGLSPNDLRRSLQRITLSPA
jgi:DNA-binding NtrC family response regulator